jgi:hypothetical protein
MTRRRDRLKTERVTTAEADDMALRRRCLAGTRSYQSALTAAGLLTPLAPLTAVAHFRIASR